MVGAMIVLIKWSSSDKINEAEVDPEVPAPDPVKEVVVPGPDE